MGTSRGYGGSANSKYGGSSGYGGSGSSYLNTSYGAPRSTYRQSSYEPRLSGYVGSGSVMDRVKQFNPETRSGGSYTPLNSRRSTSRDYGGGWDKYSRSGGSDYSASNRSGYLSDYGGSTPSLYGSWDRTSSIGRYGGASRETSPVSSRPPPRQYDYSSSASPSPYSTYRRGSDARSPSVQTRYERQNSRPIEKYERSNSRPSEAYERQNSRTSDVYEDTPSRPRRKWESEVYGVASTRKASRETLPEPVKPPPKDYSSDSDDSAPEDDKGRSKYMMSRGTSPMPEPGKQNRRSKDMSSAISKNKRVKCPKDTRSRNRLDVSRRRRLVDCSTQTNLDDPGSSRRNRQGGQERRANRDEMAKMAALALLKDDDDTPGEGFHKNRDRFQQNSTPLSPPPNKKSFEGSPRQDNEKRGGWRKSVYEDPAPPKQRNDSLEVPDDKGWRKQVYGEPAPAPAPLGRLKHYQTEEDLRLAVDGPKSTRVQKAAQLALHEQDSTESPDPDDRPVARRDRRSYNEAESGKRRSQNESEKRRSSSRDSMLDDRPNRGRRQRTSSRELLDESEPSQHSGRTALTPDSLSLRDSIEKVQHWKQNLPPGIQDNHNHLTVNTGDPGFPRSDSGEYFSAQSHDSGRPYKDKMYAQQHSPHSPQQYEDPFSDREEEVLSPGGSRRRRVRRHLSRDMSQESYDEERTHHPVNKERMRKSELNRNAEKERKELEDLERRRRIYAGEDPAAVEESLRKKRSDTSSDVFFRDESPSRRRSRHASRHNSREDILDEKRPRKDKRGSDAHASDSSQFGFNKEGSPNRPGSRVSRRSRHSSQEGILEQDNQYLRPHSMVVSNESLARLSAAGSIPSMHSAMTDDGTIQNAASMQSLESNEVQEAPSSSGSLPDIVPGEQIGSRVSKGKKSKQGSSSGLIGRTGDIDNLLNFSPNEEEFVEKGRGIKEIRRQKGHILDQPVPREPSPLKPQNSGKTFKTHSPLHKTFK